MPYIIIDKFSEWNRPASLQELTEFEGSLTATSRVTITCGPCTWKVHIDLLSQKIHNGPLAEYEYSRKFQPGEEKRVDIDDVCVFTFARLLQYIYYGTYSYKANDPIAPDANLARPGFPRLSPAMIVRCGLTEPSNQVYAGLKAKDDTTVAGFGHEVHLSIHTLAEKNNMWDLQEDTLKRYSTFPFKNHREFYYSVTDEWPLFPSTEQCYYGGNIFRAVVPHIAKFWKEARIAERRDHRLEAKQMLKWVRGDDPDSKRLLKMLLDHFGGNESAEQAAWENHCMDVDCERCGRPDREDSDSEDDLSEAWWT